MTTDDVTDEMVERAAGAYHDFWRSYREPRWNELSEIDRTEYVDAMRAALSAVLPAAREQARREALEEAAALAKGYHCRECGRVGDADGLCCSRPNYESASTAKIATAIRSLIDKENPDAD